MPGTLIPAPNRAAAVIRKTERRIVSRAERTVAAALRASEIEDGACAPPEGMTEREFRVARDARLPKSKAPMYLEIAEKVLQTNAKLEAARRERAPQQVLNIGAINIVKPPEYEVRVIEEHK